MDTKSAEILDAAAYLFRERSVEGASLRAIADRADVLLGSLTYRFPNKESLLQALLARTGQQIQSALQSAIDADAAPSAQLQLAVRSYLTELLNEGDAVFVLMFEYRRLPATVQQSIRRHRQEIDQQWTTLLDAALPEVRPSARRLLRRQLVGSLNTVAYWFQEDGELSITEVADQYLQNLLKGQAPGLTPQDQDWLAESVPGWAPIDMQTTTTNRNFVSGDRSGRRLFVDYYRTADNGLRAKVIVGTETQGPPGHAHGGSMAALLDELMGGAAWVAGHRVLAVSLTTNFRSKLPLGAQVIGSGEVTRVEGRKVFAQATLKSATGHVYAEGDGIFLQLTGEQLAELEAALTPEWQRAEPTANVVLAL